MKFIISWFISLTGIAGIIAVPLNLIKFEKYSFLGLTNDISLFFTFVIIIIIGFTLNYHFIYKKTAAKYDEDFKK